MKCPLCQEHPGYADTPCNNCDGLGYISELGVTVGCMDCAGRGLAPCPYCYGTAYVSLGVDCPRCDGTGTVECDYCFGNGIIDGAGVDCPVCHTLGVVDCPKCRGCGHWELGLYNQTKGALRPRYERIGKHG